MRYARVIGAPHANAGGGAIKRHVGLRMITESLR